MDINEDKYYDKDLPMETWELKLPHRSQKGKLQFVTIHLGDSLPKVLLDELKAKKKKFMEAHPLPWNKEVQKEYHRVISNPMHKYLDAGFGSCIFRYKQYRDILSEAIHRRNTVKFEMHCYVIMPNHLHMLVEEFGEKTLLKSIGEIMRYTSYKINSMTGRKGSLWSRDKFDRMIRNQEHYNSVADYIRRNPMRLFSSDYELYFAPFMYRT